MDGWQRAFVLHSRPWSETSLMLDVFTEESGRVRLVAKGARSKRSNLKGALQPFTPLLVRFGGRGEVKTLRSAEAVSLALPLSREIRAPTSHGQERGLVGQGAEAWGSGETSREAAPAKGKLPELLPASI